MSCNGCRALRKGCSDKCMLRQCLRCIDSPQAQAHATLFVAKFFGRAALLSFLSNVPHSQRSPLFRSLLFEAVGRTISPVNGAVGLLWSGNWRLCQTAVETVLRGGTIHALPDPSAQGDSEAGDNYCLGPAVKRRKVNGGGVEPKRQSANLELSLSSGSMERKTSSAESETTVLGGASVNDSTLHHNHTQAERKLLRLFF